MRWTHTKIKNSVCCSYLGWLTMCRFAKFFFFLYDFFEWLFLVTKKRPPSHTWYFFFGEKRSSQQSACMWLWHAYPAITWLHGLHFPPDVCSAHCWWKAKDRDEKDAERFERSDHAISKNDSSLRPGCQNWASDAIQSTRRHVQSRYFLAFSFETKKNFFRITLFHPAFASKNTLGNCANTYY